MSKILAARTRAELTQRQVALAINRSHMWLSLVERGQLGIEPDVELRILLAIERLSAHRERIRRDYANTVRDLRLPRCAAL